MPVISTYVNKMQLKELKKGANASKLSLSQYNKKVLLNAIAERKKGFMIRTSIIYGFTLYSLVISAVLLVF